jgi:hypothetical protein
MPKSKPAGIHRRLKINLTPSLIARMKASVDKCGPDECWPWKRSPRNGYGAIKHERRVLSAHRVAYVIAKGEPKPGMLVTHSCDNRICCNPKHLIEGTTEKNNQEISERKRRTIINGGMAYNAVLNDELVAKIWKLRRNGSGHVLIARAMGLNANTVKNVLGGRSWSHLMPEWAKQDS